MATKFTIQTEWNGYRHKESITNLPPGILIPGSQNVLTNNGERVAARKGYTLFGQANVAFNGIESSFDWHRVGGSERHLRSYQDELEYLFVAADGTPTWRRLANGFGSSVVFNFDNWWDKNEQLDLLLFVNNTNNVYEWSGGVATFKSASNATGVIASYDQLGAITTFAVNAAGLGYKVGDVLTIKSGDQKGTVEVSTVGGSGTVTAVISGPSSGGGYVVAGNIPTKGGSGLGCTIDVTGISSDAGSGYVVGDTLTVSGGGANAVLTIDYVTPVGAVATVRLTNPGTGYSTGAANATTTSGAGTGAKVNINTIAQGYIEKEGTTTWGQEGFYTQGSRLVVIDSVNYSYTGGEDTTFLVGISPDPTAVVHAVGAPIHQQIRTTAMTSFTGASESLATFKCALIAVLTGYVFYGSLSSRDIYMSGTDSYQDISYTSPRIQSQGFQLLVDSAPSAFKVEEENLYISGGSQDWAKVVFQLSADQLSETVFAQRLKTTIQQGAQSQAFVTKDKNSVVFLSEEPTITTLGRIQLVQTPQNVDISDPIKYDMQAYDFTGGSMMYFQNFLYVAVPREGLYRMFNIQKQWWEAPQTGQFSRFAIIDGELYAHSSAVPETYKLNTGVNDNGAPINSIAAFSYQSFGDRPNQKSFEQFYTEGYISSNTELTLRVLFDYKGSRGSMTKIISGSPASYTSNQQVLFIPAEDGSFGKNSLGKLSFAGRGATDDTSLPPKFRIINTNPKQDFYEMQLQYQSYQDDAQWQILAAGPAVSLSTNGNNNITI